MWPAPSGNFEYPQGIGYDRPPFANLVAGSGSLSAGPLGLTLFRFGWADSVTGQVGNAYEAGARLGLVLPIYNLGNWQRAYRQGREYILRAGQQVVLATQGNFPAFFKLGARAGQRVFASMTDGCAYAFPSNYIYDSGGRIIVDSSGRPITGSFLPTHWVVMRNVGCNSFATMSSFVSPFN